MLAISVLKRVVFSAAFLLLAASIARGQGVSQKSSGSESHLKSDRAIEKLISPIRDKQKLPGLLAGIFDARGVKAIGAIGVRKFGSAEPLLVNDKLRLGTCTQTMTGTQVALVVQEKKLSWESTIGEVLSDLNSGLHADFGKVIEVTNLRSSLTL